MAGPGGDLLRKVGLVVDLLARRGALDQSAVAEHLALPGAGEDDELVAEVAADRAGVGAHRDRAQPHAGEGAQIGDEHPVVGPPGAGMVEVEGIGVLHQELAAAHDAEPGAELVAELPLDVVEDFRQRPIAPDVVPEDVGDLLLVGRAVEHVAVVAVDDAQHLPPVAVIAPALAPEVGRLDRRHQHFLGAGAALLVAHDGLDLAQDPEAQRQPGIDAGAGLADHARAQHQPVRGDLRLGRVFPRGRDEIAGQAHALPVRRRADHSAIARKVESAPAQGNRIWKFRGGTPTPLSPGRALRRHLHSLPPSGGRSGGGSHPWERRRPAGIARSANEGCGPSARQAGGTPALPGSSPMSGIGKVPSGLRSPRVSDRIDR